jgi:ABC-type cobalt transport system substrate-binding protein
MPLTKIFPHLLMSSQISLGKSAIGYFIGPDSVKVTISDRF